MWGLDSEVLNVLEKQSTLNFKSMIIKKISIIKKLKAHNSNNMNDTQLFLKDLSYSISCSVSINFINGTLRLPLVLI